MMKEKLNHLLYTMTHTLDGYYEIRHRDKGSISLALVILLLTSIAFCIDKRYASFTVNVTDIRNVKSLLYIGAMILLFFLFCIGNWAVTCITNGEGRMKDIVIATGYGLVPIPLLFIPGTVISHFLAGDEKVFYSLFIYLAIVWAAIMVICGNMIIHNYTVGQELKTLVLTVIAMIIMLFIMLLFYSIFGQMVGFLKSLYTEIIYRI
jgi:hypothetical protein